MQLYPLAPSKLDAAWPHVAHLFEQVAEGSRGRESLESLYQAAKAGAYVLWLVMDTGPRALVIARIIQHPFCRVLRIFGCVGEGYQDWAHLLEDIETWAREGGFAEVEISARPGWSRVLKDYTVTHYVMVKAL